MESPIKIKPKAKYLRGGSAKGTKGGPKAAPKKARKKNGPKPNHTQRVMVMDGRGRTHMKDA